MYGYNSGYGYGVYPTQFTQQPQQPQFQQPQFQQNVQSMNRDDRIYVQGEVGAKAYLVANGATVTLWDSEQPHIYIKSVSANGIPSMQTLNYSYNDPRPVQQFDVSSFETRIKNLESTTEKLKKMLDSRADKEVETDVQ